MKDNKITLTATLPPKENMVRLEFGDKLLIDPGYIRGVYGEWDETLEPRFDALRCEKVLHEGDDGFYGVMAKHADGRSRGIVADLGVDSGRIWLLNTEFGVYVDIDAGLSGYEIIKAKDAADYQEFAVVGGYDE